MTKSKALYIQARKQEPDTGSHDYLLWCLLCHYCRTRASDKISGGIAAGKFDQAESRVVWREINNKKGGL